MTFKKIPALILQIPIHLYRLVISPWLPRTCRFKPTCSSYALQALEKHGCFKGSWLGLKRICKCHPYCKAPYDDPVP